MRAFFILTKGYFMKKYEGKKQILATPMSRLEYNEYRGWQLPENENGSDEGFLVEYIDGGEANHPDHAGYISWSPKVVFENAYNPIDTYAQRIQLEYAELSQKITKLQVFLESDDFPKLEYENQRLLQKQYTHMNEYLIILYTRMRRSLV